MPKPFRFWSLFSRSGRTPPPQKLAAAKRRQRTLGIEPLESRQMLAGTPIVRFGSVTDGSEGQAAYVAIHRDTSDGSLTVYYAGQRRHRHQRQRLQLRQQQLHQLHLRRRAGRRRDHHSVDRRQRDRRPRDHRTRLHSGAGYVLGSPNGATVTIEDNDQPRVSVFPGQDAYENGQAGTLTIHRSIVDGNALTVSFSFTGTATLSADYNAEGSVTIPAYCESAEVYIGAFIDGLSEGNESVVLVLGDGGSAYLVDPQYASAAITLH